jgi:hypothetical protein
MSLPPPPLELSDQKDNSEIAKAHEWSEQEEYLLALWSDRSLCYKLMNERASRKFHKEHLCFSIPVIILSTLCGSANLAVQSYVPQSEQQMASMIIGLVSIGAGILTTLQNFFASAQKSEAHRNSVTSWGKLHRQIYTELSLERDKRKPVKDFVRLCKNEYDRILDQSPVIPSPILRRFVQDIKQHPKMMLPEECGNLLHTTAWERVQDQRIAFLESKEERMLIEVETETP